MKKALLFSLLFLFISGCSFFEDEEENDYISLFFRPKYISSSSKPWVQLLFQTEKFYNSTGYVIDIEKKLEGSVLELHIKGVHEEGGYDPVYYPAFANVDINELRGRYGLIIKGDNFKDIYFITISDTLTYITGPETPHTEPSYRYVRYDDPVK